MRAATFNTPLGGTMLGLLAVTPIFAQEPSALYAFAAPADWIDVVSPEYDAPKPSGAGDAGSWILLIDRQINVNADGDDAYQHVAVKVMDATGVADNSQLNIGVDPAYQSLELHWLRVVRGDAIMDQREVARITALPEEAQLQSSIYSGRYNVNVLLSDVRAGDVVEFAYTLRSAEQLFPGHFATRLDMAWGMALRRERIRVLSSPTRPLRYRLSDGTPIPEPRARENRREVELERLNVAPITVDAGIPSWHYPWPYLEISDLGSWHEASALVRPLFAPRPTDSGAVAAIVEEIRAAADTKREQALRALQYVQREIRYTSIAIGRGSFEPAHPDVTLQRRFGDCKDKALLLAAVLNGLGIEAVPALVHSWRGRTLVDALPTPYAFDHAIVRAKIDDDVYWLDGTSPPRYSPLSTDGPASYSAALLTDGSDLVSVPRTAMDSSRRDVSAVLDLRSGLEEAGTLDVTTRYEGALADALRPLLARGTPEQRQADYATYTSRYYPGAVSAGAPTIRDDKIANVVEIRERYTLESAFTRDESGVLSLTLHADELYPYAEPRGTGPRQMPLDIDYPVWVRQQITAHLPEPWFIEPKTVAIDGSTFRYRGDVGYTKNTLTLAYEYQALSDHVPLAALAQYQADRARLYDDLGYILTYNEGLQAARLAIAPLPLITMLLALGLGAWGALRWLYRYDPEPRPSAQGTPAGIRGWLLLPAIGTILSPFVLGWLIYSWAPFVDASVWYALPTAVGEPYRGSAHAVLLAIVGGGILLWVASLTVAVLFFKKRTSAPAAYVALAWLGTVFGVAVVVWGIATGLDTETDPVRFAAATVRDLVLTAAWTLYMLTSRRVTATFVQRLHRPAHVAAQTPAVEVS